MCVFKRKVFFFLFELYVQKKKGIIIIIMNVPFYKAKYAEISMHNNIIRIFNNSIEIQTNYCLYI